jgi:hypothetical protein
MICPVCRHPIPDNMMTCPACASRKSAQAILAFQLGPLRKIAAGQAGLVVRAVAGKRHVQLFGAEQAFCGVAISPQHRRSHIPFESDELAKICSACRIELTRAMEEARRPG